MRIWIDVEDLFVYRQVSPRPSGIQRFSFELQSALRKQAGADAVRFVRHNLAGDNFVEVPWDDVQALFQNMIGEQEEIASVGIIPEPPPPTPGKLRQQMRHLVNRLPVPVHQALIRAVQAQKSACRAQIEVLRGLGALGRALLRRKQAPIQPAEIAVEIAPPPREIGPPLADLVAPGDIFAIFGSPWFRSGYGDMLHALKISHGLRVLLLIYDLIPVRHPEWCVQALVQSFTEWLGRCLPQADILLAISRASAADLERYAEERGIKLPQPVKPIPVGTGFSTLPATVVRNRETNKLPEPGTYALFVSTIEARKNHQLLFRVWRQLLTEMPRDDVPTLVFAGRVGWLVQDFIQQLHNTQWLDGKIQLIEDPSDDRLAALYRGCLFTLYPSFYEGWGLPVSESFVYGKPCVASNVTSVPEAGGTLARYFDPNTLSSAVEIIRTTIEDRADLAAWQQRVVRDFRPVSWDDSARAVMDYAGNSR